MLVLVWVRRFDIGVKVDFGVGVGSGTEAGMLVLVLQ